MLGQKYVDWKYQTYKGFQKNLLKHWEISQDPYSVISSYTYEKATQGIQNIPSEQCV